MSFPSKYLILFLIIATAQAVDKDKEGFRPQPASSYPTRQTIQKVTIAAIPYDSESAAKSAFGKLNPYEHGVLPVLVLIQNDTAGAINLENVKVEYVDRDRSRVEAVPATEVKYLYGGRRPKLRGSPIPSGSPRISRGKNPLDQVTIELRSFQAKMLPPGDSAHGFFYFQTGHRSGAKLYVTGLREAATKQELFYFEIPLNE